ncbi:MAG: HAD family phosphatase [Lachnospiraceae bacterium]|nr:HAD family phosphatase [Lachnospiraceae bacterium]
MILQGKKAVIFDLDGTLIDSMWMWPEIDSEYLGQYGYGVPEDLQTAIEGMSFTETAVYFKERFHIPDPIEAIKLQWNEMAYEKYTTEVPLKPGAGNLLAELKRRDIFMGIATSNSTELAQAVLDALGVKGYFQTVTTSCEVAAGKPAPDIYLHVAAKLGVQPEECLVFEDVPAGIRAGKRAGMEVIAVADAFSQRDEAVKRKLADGFLTDFETLFSGHNGL